MSIQNVAWVLEQYIPNAGAKLVLLCIANHTHRAMDFAFPSVKTLAHESSMTTRTVQRHIRWLQDNNYLFVQEDFAESGRRRSNRYVLNFDRRPDSVSDLKGHPDREGVKLSGSPEQGKNMLSETDGEGCQSVTLGGCQIVRGEGDTAVRGEGDTAVRGEGDTAVTPINLTGIRNRNKEPSPLTPRGEPGGGDSDSDLDHPSKFFQFRAVWDFDPLEGTVEAEKAFSRLSALERVQAIEHAMAYQTSVRDRGRKMPAAKTYLNGRRWATSVDRHAAPDGSVIITPDMSEWTLWKAYRKRVGQRVTLMDAIERKSKNATDRFFVVPSLSPPAGDEQTDSVQAEGGAP